jgi:hypothetical protein
MPTREDRGKDLLDHVVLADDDFLQFFLHELPVLAELLQNIAETTGLRGQREILLSVRSSLFA